MTHTMRRKRQTLVPDVCTDILTHASAGVLALADQSGQPYAVPLSYVYVNGTLYFHSAKAGYKLDLIRENPRASFCVIADDHIVPERFTTYYRSVIACGTVQLVNDDDEARPAPSRSWGANMRQMKARPLSSRRSTAHGQHSPYSPCMWIHSPAKKP